MAEPLKNMYNRPFVEALSAAVQAVYAPFDSPSFIQQVLDADWEARELKARMRHIVICLGGHLPADYPRALAILRQVAPQLEGFVTMLFPDFVEVYGLGHWEESLAALEQFTQQSSAEYAVRPFILQDQARMMAHMEQWSRHESHHVRRLASEGCRPRLPWAVALPAFKADPSPILPILEQLKTDESEYVRRSVANNLNDIAKDHPQVVVDVLHGWQKIDSPEMRWMTNHALRTLVKAGNSAALALLGVDDQAAVTLHEVTLTPTQLAEGETLTFSFELESHAAQTLVIDYAVYFLRANGTHSRKVFKLTKTQLAAGERLRLTRKHSFRPITTRRYYPGEQGLEIQVNGKGYGRHAFVLH